MLTKHIFLSIVNQFYSLPILVELRNLNDSEISITDYISNIILKNKLGRNEKILERILSEGNFVFIFDGYDEIFSEHKDRITNEIEEFVDLYNKNSFIITSRPGANAESLQRFDNLYVQPLDNKQIKEFVSLQFKNHENKESIGKIISVIDKPDNQDYKDYLSSPLLLSMFIFTFNNYPELPKTKSKFYWNVFDTLCTKHDAFTKKGFWLHERKSKLLNEEFENLLRWFSYLTFFKGRYNFDQEYLKTQIKIIKDKLNISASIDDLIYDLSVSISILIQDGTDYTFPHKSLQEYFTASLIKGLNEKQKEEIYCNKFKNLKRLSRGGNSNFYKLCYELDKYYFSKYFLIKETEEFLSKITNTNDESITKSLISAFNIKFIYQKDGENFRLSGYSYNYLPVDSFISFLIQRELVGSFEKVNKANYIIADLLSELSNADENNTRAELDFNKNWSENEVKYLQEAGIIENFLKLYEELVFKINSIKKETQMETNNTQELLDI